MRVAMVLGRDVHPDGSGEGTFCRNLVPGLLEIGVGVELVGDGRWAELCKAWGVTLHEGGILKARRRADVFHLSASGGRATAAALATGRGVVATHHNYRFVCPAALAWHPQGCDAGPRPGPCDHCPRRGIAGALRTRALRALASRCVNVAVSRALFERLGLPNGEWILNPMPVTAGPCTDPETEGPILFAGKIWPEKGLDLLLRAIARVPAARLDVAGDGPEREACTKLAESLGIASRVRFLGWVSQQQMHELRQRAVLVCVPSRLPDPLPYSAAEAMAADRAVVASDTGGLPELLGGGRGWLCPPTVDAWAEALQEALGDPAKRERRAHRALEFVRRELAPVTVARRYQAAYQRALG